MRVDFIWNEVESKFWPVIVGSTEFLSAYWDADICGGADKRTIDLRGRSLNVPSFKDEAAEHAKTFKPNTREPDKTARIKGWCTVD